MKKIEKAVLVFPRFKYKPGDPPLGVAYVAAQLRKETKINVKILDTTFNPSFEYAAEFLKKEMPDIVGIYFDTLMYNDGIKIADIAKNFGSYVVAGGPHATISPETLIDKVDAVVLGEGEYVFSELVKRLPAGDLGSVKGIWYKKGKKVFKNPRREPIKNLDALELPARDLLDIDEYIKHWHILDGININLKGTNIVASRGCPYNCTYCQPTLRTMFGNKVNARSPKKIVEEIKQLKNTYKINAFFFHDDTLSANRPWVMEFCDLLKKENLGLLWACNTRANTLDEEMMKLMHESGLRMFHMGVESGSQRILNEIYKKGITLERVKSVIDTANRIGIKTLCFFMLGAPTETEEEIKQTIKFAASLNAIEVTATITTPLPGTMLHEKMKEEYEISNVYSDFDYYRNRSFEDKNLPFKKLKHYQKMLLLKFYTSPKRWPYVLSHLTSVNGWKKMISKISRFM